MQQAGVSTADTQTLVASPTRPRSHAGDHPRRRPAQAQMGPEGPRSGPSRRLQILPPRRPANGSAAAQLLACMRNGRRDDSYQKWRWQPTDCDLPRYVFFPSFFPCGRFTPVFLSGLRGCDLRFGFHAGM